MYATCFLYTREREAATSEDSEQTKKELEMWSRRLMN